MWETMWRSSDLISTDTSRLEHCPECGGNLVPVDLQKWPPLGVEENNEHHPTEKVHMPFKIEEKSEHEYSVCCMPQKIQHGRAHCGTGAVLAIVTALTVLGGSSKQCGSQNSMVSEKRDLPSTKKPAKQVAEPALYFISNGGAVQVDAGSTHSGVLWTPVAALDLCTTDQGVAAFTISANVLASSEAFVARCIGVNSEPPCFTPQNLSLEFRIVTNNGVELCKRIVDYAAYVPCALGSAVIGNHCSANIRFPVSFELYCKLPCADTDQPLRLQAALASTEYIPGVTIKDLQWSALVWN